jgi:hypothetical protein
MSGSAMWQRKKSREADRRAASSSRRRRFASDACHDLAIPRPKSATFRPERFHEPEPMPEPKSWRPK